MEIDKRDEEKTKEELLSELEDLRRVVAKFVDFETEEKLLLEKRLKESEERFREIFEQHYDAIILLEPDQLKCVDANLTAETLFGYSYKELRENFPRLFKSRKDFERFKKIIKNSRQKDFLIEQFTFLGKNGVDVICGVKGKTIKLREKNVLYCSFRDIKEKIEAEEKEKRIQAKLIETNKMTSLGTLASGIAHEINNPNNFILANTQMFAEIWQDAGKILQSHYSEHGDFTLGGLSFTELMDTVPGLLTGSMEGSRRIMNIINRLKEFSRPVDDHLHGRVDINQVIQFSLSMLSSQIKKYTDSFTINLAEHIPEVSGNSQQLEQVIINLVQNALQALPNRNHGVFISSSFNKSADYVMIKVKDEGTGMKKEIVERITEPFFTTKKDSGGTGLGLYISYSIVKKHNGILDIKSRPGKGTEISIKLPVLIKGDWTAQLGFPYQENEENNNE